MAKTDIDNIIATLDTMSDSGISRLKIDISGDVAEGDVVKKYHHGRCDVGSPFATGRLFDFEDETEGEEHEEIRNSENN